MPTPYRIAGERMQSPELEPRELQVLFYLTRGLKNCEIAWKLGISLDTVKRTCIRIFDRLGVDNRVQAARVALERKLLDRWLDLGKRENEVRPPAPLLTPHELWTLWYLAQPLRQDAIASRMNVTRSAVHWHCDRLYRKLGVNNRLQAVRVALELDLLGKLAALHLADPRPGSEISSGA